MRRAARAYAFVRPPWRHWACGTGAMMQPCCGCSQESGATIATKTVPSATSSRTEAPHVVQGKWDPMATLTGVFRSHPSALRLHRELTICIANGDAEGAADVASVLAQTVRRVVQQSKEDADTTGKNTTPDLSIGASSSTSGEYVPEVGPDDIELSVEQTRRSMLAKNGDKAAEAFIEDCGRSACGAEIESPVSVELPFWKQPSALRVTLLETAFEMTLPNGDHVENPLNSLSAQAEQHEKERMSLLDEYLTREKARWEAQKKGIGRVLLSTAQRLGITPEDLHSALHEGGNTRAVNHDGRLHVLKHCNLIVRGEAPEMMELLEKGANGDVGAVAAEEFEVLVRRMESSGAPLSPSEKEMALFELVMTKSKMRYVVGLHRELQLALDGSEPLRKLASQNVVSSSGSEVFVQKAIEALNKVAPNGTETRAEEVELIEAVSTPVLPFTFMLKMCFWFDTTR
ncbi:hypothetical protein DQ04_04851010 [Trypanosoma grayi]|uniref:hypothetical protein n=1 Tax=Trypanosoma grayi TaxID=71804 RepID=UPI0004F42A67|nr:hypothetical protein DQ04_04851010 [Trypanosoma grayi]KEG09659.1 hypothetical protein DQ04_04851010 [Trypanosoma grayi]